MKENKFRISRDSEIITPRAQKLYPVDKVDWERLKKMVEKSMPNLNIWQIIFPASFGIAFSALIGGITVCQDNSNRITCFWIGGLFALIGLLSLIFYFVLKKQCSYSKAQIWEEMGIIESKLEEINKPKEKLRK